MVSTVKSFYREAVAGLSSILSKLLLGLLLMSLQLVEPLQHNWARSHPQPSCQKLLTASILTAVIRSGTAFFNAVREWIPGANFPAMDSTAIQPF